MKTISKSENRKVILKGIEEGWALISEHDSYVINGRRRWAKTTISLSPDELREITKLIEKYTGTENAPEGQK